MFECPMCRNTTTLSFGRGVPSIVTPAAGPDGNDADPSRATPTDGSGIAAWNSLTPHAHSHAAHTSHDRRRMRAASSVAEPEGSSTPGAISGGRPGPGCAPWSAPDPDPRAPGPASPD